MIHSKISRCTKNDTVQCKEVLLMLMKFLCSETMTSECTENALVQRGICKHTVTLYAESIGGSTKTAVETHNKNKQTVMVKTKSFEPTCVCKTKLSESTLVTPI